MVSDEMGGPGIWHCYLSYCRAECAAWKEKVKKTRGRYVPRSHEREMRICRYILQYSTSATSEVYTW